MTREETILKRIRRGDLSCLDELIALYYPDIFRYCLWHTSDRQTAEDAAQETFLKLIRHLDSLDHRPTLKAYIYKIASNICIDLWRKKSAEELSEDTPYLERGYDEAEADTDFMRIVKALPEEQREIVILRFSQDLTLKEIAETVELPLRTVQSRLRNALKKLKKAYQKREEKNERII